MPVTKSARKKLRKDKGRTAENKKIKNLFKSAVKKAQKNKTEKVVRDAIKLVDKAAKKNIIHKNKASRLKSSLSKLFTGKAAKTRKTRRK